MTVDKKRRFYRSPFFLFLLLPIFLSILIHLGCLIYARFTPWQFGYVSPPQSSQSILVDIKKEPETPVGAPRKASPERHKMAKVRPQDLSRRMQSDPGGEGGKGEALGILAGDEGAAWLKVDPEWGSGGGTLHDGPQESTQTFAEYIEALRSRGLDIVIVFDSTASMKSMMKEIKLKISNLAMALRRLVPSCRIGFVTYRDIGGEYVTKVQSLTYGVSSLQRFLNSTQADEGGDLREAVDAGLQVAVERMNWNRKSKPFILLIGDAPPHKQEMDRCIALAKKFRKGMGGTISALDVRETENITREQWEHFRAGSPDPELETYNYKTNPENVDDSFQTIAEAGGGESARLINEEKLIKHMLLYIFGTQWESYLTEIMKSL